jgi:hypothetical protein
MPPTARRSSTWYLPIVDGVGPGTAGMVRDPLARVARAAGAGLPGCRAPPPPRAQLLVRARSRAPPRRGTRREITAIVLRLLRLRTSSWIAGALCVLVCVSFVARALGHVIEARYLAEPTAAPLPPRSAPPPITSSSGGGEASALVDRNPFCSDCATGPGDPLSPPGVAASRLPIVLVATSLAPDPADSYATLVNLESGAQGAFWVGHRVPGGGVIERVAGTYVWLRTGDGAVERIDLLAIAAAPAEPPAPPKPKGDAPAWSERVKKLDDATYEVDRQLVRDLVGGGATAKVPGVRVMPATGKDGKLRGVRISQARKDSLAAGLGLRTGDVIEAIDGKALDSPDVLLAAYGELERAAAARVSISRGGKPIEIEYRLR